jgi:riboflavin biosynthesis pyrimidine reductase
LPKVIDSIGAYPIAADEYFRELVSGFAITASLVSDQHGNTVSSDGSSAGLGNETDLSLLVALRRQSQMILTSGKTFRSDQYKFPKRADLAVLTNRELDIAAPTGQKLIVSNLGYQQTLTDLILSGYKRVHVEYGITGIRALIEAKALDALLLSSRDKSGVLALALELKVEPLLLELEDLYVGLVAWQPDSNQLAR